jgi:pimeloyl-ACP methyl ester carboxylesterase
MSSNTIFIFVPGIMGSSLRFKGTGSYGQPVDEEVWGSSVPAIERLLGLSPDYLRASNVEPGEVILEFRFGRFRVSQLYGPVIRYLTSAQPSGMGLVQGTNFFPFPYDWRADNLETADKLAGFIRQSISSEETKVRIITHSMGGIVARLMLVKAKDVARQTDKLFQIASPIQGSTKAYYSLKQGPRIHQLIDKVWNFLHRLDPTRRHRLQQALQQCHSLYQLLPPPDVQILRNTMGDRYSAFDEGIWASLFKDHVDRAKQVHTLLRTKIPQSIKCIYSTCHDTDADYIVDQFFNYQAVLQPQGAGDGTVVGASAIAMSDMSDRILIEKPFEQTSHDGLCQNSRVLQELKTHMLE